MKLTCKECNQDLPETNFWEVRIGRNEYKRFDKCKQCCLKSINIYDYKSIIPLLEELNFPYIQKELSAIYRRCWDKDPSCRTAISRYLSKMKLMSFRSYTFEDSNMLNEINEKGKKEMKKYKVVAMPTSSTEDKINACLHFLKEKQAEKQYKYSYEPDSFKEEWTEAEKYAWQCGWEIAMSVAYHNLKCWFPECFDKETK